MRFGGLVRFQDVVLGEGEREKREKGEGREGRERRERKERTRNEGRAAKQM
jgi:hypothetical protein